MSFNAIFEAVYGLLAQDASLVPGILGPRTVQNMRVYRAWPAWQSLLTSYEPNQPAEGFLVIEEPIPLARMTTEQLTSNHEYVTLKFHVYGTTYSVTHAVLDVFDQHWHWEIAQQREVQWDERILVFARRAHEVDKYEQGVKLYSKEISYNFEFVRDVALYP